MPGPSSRGPAQQDRFQGDAAVGHALGMAERKRQDQLLEQGPDLGLHISLHPRPALLGKAGSFLFSGSACLPGWCVCSARSMCSILRSAAQQAGLGSEDLCGTRFSHVRSEGAGTEADGASVQPGAAGSLATMLTNRHPTPLAYRTLMQMRLWKARSRVG